MNLLTVKQVAAKLSVAVSYVYKIQKNDPAFPRPIYLGAGEVRPRGARWVDEAINKWLIKQHPEVLTNDRADEDRRPDCEIHQGQGSEVAA